MSAEKLSQYQRCTKQDLEVWIDEVSSFHGKCCYISKKSQLRSKLISKLSPLNENEESIIRIFDEQLWIQDGNICEVCPDGLIKLQNAISINLPFQRIYNQDNYDVKNEFFLFTISQSTLLALFISSIIFSRAILKIFNSVYALEVGLSWMYFLTFFFVISIIDHESKRFWLSIGVVIFLLHLLGYFYYFPYGTFQEYIDLENILKLSLFFIFNMILLGTALFSSLYSVGKLLENRVNFSKTLNVFIALFIYAFLIVVFIQGVSTITIN